MWFTLFEFLSVKIVFIILEFFFLVSQRFCSCCRVSLCRLCACIYDLFDSNTLCVRRFSLVSVCYAIVAGVSMHKLEGDENSSKLHFTTFTYRTLVRATIVFQNSFFSLSRSRSLYLSISISLFLRQEEFYFVTI